MRGPGLHRPPLTPEHGYTGLILPAPSLWLLLDGGSVWAAGGLVLGEEAMARLKDTLPLVRRPHVVHRLERNRYG